MKKGIMFIVLTLVIAVGMGLVITAIFTGCNGEQESSQVSPPVASPKPLAEHLVQLPQDWKDAYGDNTATQVVYNLAILRNNDMVIAQMINKLHPADVNDPKE